MKCFFHNERDAVATCQSCGKALCKPCAEKYNPCMCDECVSLRNISITEKKKAMQKNALIDTTSEFIVAILKGLTASYLITLLFNAISSSKTNTVPISMSVMLFFVPFGWALITYMEQWFPGVWMSGAALIIYIWLKLSFSMILGIPCFIYQLGKFLVKIIVSANKK